MGKSNIGYIDYVWNPYDDHCTKVSAGCKFCYAAEMTERFGKIFTGTPNLRPTADKLLAKIPAGQIVGVNFLSDTWHEGVPLETIQYVHRKIEERPDCIFVYTTKRSQRLALESHKVAMPRNLWVGVSVENATRVNRIAHLRHSFARNGWISFEPLLGHLELTEVDLDGIDWIVTGGESGPNRRSFAVDWAKAIGQLARNLAIPWFHKQGSHLYPGRNEMIGGQVIHELPKEWEQLKAAPVVENQPKLF